MISNKYLLTGIRVVLGSVFVWSGILKIREPLEFAQNVANYRIFPAEISFLAGIVLPWVELICGVLLIIGLFRNAGALILVGLLCAFLVLIVTTMIRGIDVDCGCFGPIGRKVDYFLLLTDTVLLYLAFNIFLSSQRPATGT